eukprot:13298396-Alexandrium_andersonii.AAC.1
MEELGIRLTALFAQGGSERMIDLVSTNQSGPGSGITTKPGTRDRTHNLNLQILRRTAQDVERTLRLPSNAKTGCRCPRVA